MILITYDEDLRMGGVAPENGFGHGGQTVCALESPLVFPNDYNSQTHAYSILRTLEDGFPISGYVANASLVASLPPVWK